MLKKYDDLKLDQLTQDKAAEQLAREFPDLGINIAKMKRILHRRDYFEADDDGYVTFLPSAKPRISTDDKSEIRLFFTCFNIF